MVKNSRKILMAAALAAALLGITDTTAKAAPGIQEEPGIQTAPEIPHKSLYVIDKNGAGDFTTIQEGVDYALDGDTLVIYPGVYTEEVGVMDKELNIIGVDRDLCILQYDATSYMHMPLTIGAGKVSNLTIYGMKDEQDKASEQDETPKQDKASESAAMPGGIVPFDWQKEYPGYAVHIDQNFLYGRSLSFENCRIVSENNSCVGIGGRGGSTVTFENCEMVALRAGGCIYLHDPVSLTESGEMAFVLKNCSLINCRSPYVLTFQSYMPELNLLKLTFQNTRVSTVAHEDGHSYIPVNVNSFWDVEGLMRLEDNGGLGTMGLTSTAGELVHEMTLPKSKAYMAKLDELVKKEDRLELLKSLKDMPPEGITYLRSDSEYSTANGKHQPVAIYNRSNMPGSGWCGLDGALLTPDSFGNTLPEMNAPAAPDNIDNLSNMYTDGVLTSDFSYDH